METLNNTLLIFKNALELVEGFNRITNKFDKNRYKMYLLNDILGY